MADLCQVDLHGDIFTVSNPSSQKSLPGREISKVHFELSAWDFPEDLSWMLPQLLAPGAEEEGGTGL